jgi:hypothetical protein
MLNERVDATPAIKIKKIEILISKYETKRLEKFEIRNRTKEKA